MTLNVLLLWCAAGIASLLIVTASVAVRRWYVRWSTRKQEMHVRVIRSELMQAVARGENRFLIDHWRRRDQIAALDVAGQILTFLDGPDRERLEQIAEANDVLRRPLQLINRMPKAKRIATIRQIAPFGNKSVQATLQLLMREDWSRQVRLEAALAITIAGDLPPPNTVIQSVWQAGKPITPQHKALLRRMANEKAEAIMALALYREEIPIRLLAIDTLAYVNKDKFEQVRGALARLLTDEHDEIRDAALASLNSLASDRRARRAVTEHVQQLKEAAKQRRLAS